MFSIRAEMKGKPSFITRFWTKPNVLHGFCVFIMEISLFVLVTEWPFFTLLQINYVYMGLFVKYTKHRNFSANSSLKFRYLTLTFHFHITWDHCYVWVVRRGSYLSWRWWISIWYFVGVCIFISFHVCVRFTTASLFPFFV